MMNEQEQTIPKGWVEVVLADLVSKEGVFSDGDWVESKDQDPSGDVRLIQLADIGEMRFLDKSDRFMTLKRANEMKCLYLKKNDLLISRLGDPLGKACLYPANEEKAVTAVDVCVFRPGNSYVDQKLVGYFLNSIAMRRLIDSQASGTTRKRITGKKLKSLTFRLPPLNEQKRIVDKIDLLFSDLDEGEALLKTVQKQLTAYRQSVLKAAVTGELTKDWREQNKHRLDPGDNLLERILQSRRENWKGRGKYQEPTLSGISSLPEVPEGWVWSSVDQICFVETGATPKKGKCSYYNQGTIPWITSTAVNQKLITEYQDLITDLALKETNVKVFPKGTLIMAMYGEGKTRGSISELGIDAGTNQACAALICAHIQEDTKEYLKLFLKYNYEIIRLKSSGGVQPNLNLSIVKETKIPLPPMAEQQEIVDRVNDIFSQMDTLENWCVKELGRSATLRQSILKSAFSGKLVSQNPADEPASELLKRIQTNHADQLKSSDFRRIQKKRISKTEAA